MAKNIPPVSTGMKTGLFSRKWTRVAAWVLCGALGVGMSTVAFFVFQGIRLAHEGTALEPITIMEYATTTDAREIAQFPVGVDPREKEITENPELDAYYGEFVAPHTGTLGSHTSWLGRVLGKLALMNWYQNLASLSSRILVIQSGERKEQIAENFGKILKWNDAQKKEFLTLIEGEAPELTDGKFFPGTYTVAKEATPQEVADMVHDRFVREVLEHYGDGVQATVPLDDALTIASLLEREAYDFEDMRDISGVIWNRLFSDMRLQIDATLQYAKGSRPTEKWWPAVRPADKYIASVYNTYKNEGLPPAPIANPSLEAILAALNPSETECMYYFHDAKAGFHCSKTYEEHTALLKQYYGRGK